MLVTAKLIMFSKRSNQNIKPDSTTSRKGGINQHISLTKNTHFCLLQKFYGLDYEMLY